MVHGFDEEDREIIESLGAIICEECGATYMPLEGFVNEGHQCGIDGTRKEFMIDPTPAGDI